MFSFSLQGAAAAAANAQRCLVPRSPQSYLPSAACAARGRIQSLFPQPRAGMATSGDASREDPKSFKYVQLWVSKDGETHVRECKMSGFDLKVYSSLPQFVKNDFGGQPTKVIFTELAPGLEQPLHPCPEVQFVVTLSGSWYIKTTDGSRYEFKAGEVLFQDNTKNSPADKLPQHFSGTVGDQPCQQLIVQLDRAPQVDNPNAF